MLSAGGVVQPARCRARLLDGGTDRRSDQPADARDAPDRARQSRRARRHRRVRRARPADPRLQPDGRGSQAAADRARTDAAPRGVGRHGAPGRARHQEPADADSAVRRARAAGQHRSGAAALAGARRVHQRHPVPGPAAAADRRRVLQLCLVGDAAPRADAGRRSRRGGRRPVSRRPGRAHRARVHAPTDLPTIYVDRTLLGRAITNVIENALHAMPGTGRLTCACGVRRRGRSGRRAVDRPS